MSGMPCRKGQGSDASSSPSQPAQAECTSFCRTQLTLALGLPCCPPSDHVLTFRELSTRSSSFHHSSYMLFSTSHVVYDGPPQTHAQPHPQTQKEREQGMQGPSSGQNALPRKLSFQSAATKTGDMSYQNNPIVMPINAKRINILP